MMLYKIRCAFMADDGTPCANEATQLVFIPNLMFLALPACTDHAKEDSKTWPLKSEVRAV